MENSAKEDFQRLIQDKVVRPLEDELNQGFLKLISVEELDIAIT